MEAHRVGKRRLKQIVVADGETAQRLGQSKPLGSVEFEAELNAKSERLVWLDRAVVDKLAGLRHPGKSYSDVILRDPAACRARNGRLLLEISNRESSAPKQRSEPMDSIFR